MTLLLPIFCLSYSQISIHAKHEWRFVCKTNLPIFRNWRWEVRSDAPQVSELRLLRTLAGLSLSSGELLHYASHEVRLTQCRNEVWRSNNVSKEIIFLLWRYYFLYSVCLTVKSPFMRSMNGDLSVRQTFPSSEIEDGKCGAMLLKWASYACFAPLQACHWVVESCSTTRHTKWD